MNVMYSRSLAKAQTVLLISWGLQLDALSAMALATARRNAGPGSSCRYTKSMDLLCRNFRCSNLRVAVFAASQLLSAEVIAVGIWQGFQYLQSGKGPDEVGQVLAAEG